MENAQTKEVSECVVPAGHVWLEGDNPENSKDSRSYGAVPTAMIIGKVCNSTPHRCSFDAQSNFLLVKSKKTQVTTIASPSTVRLSLTGFFPLVATIRVWLYTTTGGGPQSQHQRRQKFNKV